MARILIFAVLLTALVIDAAGCSLRHKRGTELTARVNASNTIAQETQKHTNATATATKAAVAAPLTKVNSSESRGVVLKAQSTGATGAHAKAANVTQPLTSNLTLAEPNAELTAEKKPSDTDIDLHRETRGNKNWLRSHLPFFDNLEQDQDIDIESLRNAMGDSWPLLSLGREYAEPDVILSGVDPIPLHDPDVSLDTEGKHQKKVDTGKNYADGKENRVSNGGEANGKASKHGSNKDESKDSNAKEPTQPASKKTHRKRFDSGPTEYVHHRAPRFESPGPLVQVYQQQHNPQRLRRENSDRDLPPMEAMESLQLPDMSFYKEDGVDGFDSDLMQSGLQSETDSDNYNSMDFMQSIYNTIDKPKSRAVGRSYAAEASDEFQSTDVARPVHRHSAAPETNPETQLLKLFENALGKLVANSDRKNEEDDFELRCPVHYQTKNIPDVDGRGHGGQASMIEVCSCHLFKKKKHA